MRWLLDQGIPRTTAELLRSRGHDAVHTGEIEMATASDAAILERGKLEDRIVVTLDADFHQLLALSHEIAPSVIRLRIEGLKAPDVVNLLEVVTTSCSTDLKSGAVISVTSQNIRVRLLPLP